MQYNIEKIGVFHKKRIWNWFYVYDI